MRTAALSDLPELLRIINLAYRVEAFCIEGERTSLEELRGLMEAGTFLVLRGDWGRLRGSVFLRPEGEGRWYLGLLAVDPDFLGQGLGRELMEGAMAHCRAAGGRFLDLTVLTARPELFAFYARFGFTANDVLPYRAPEKLKVPCRMVRFTRCLVPPEEL